MGKSLAYSTAYLQHVLQNAAIALIGDASGLQPSAAAGSLYGALHTADPGTAGGQDASECAYTDYARVAVARTSGAWSVSGNQGSNLAKVTFPQCNPAHVGSETATYFSVGASSSGAGLRILSGAITSPASGLVISASVTPEFDIGALVLQET